MNEALLVEAIESRGLKLRPITQVDVTGGTLTHHERNQLRAQMEGVIAYLRERSGLCTACGRGAARRPPSVQVSDVRAIKRAQPEVFQWPEHAYAFLENTMELGDEIAEVFAYSVIIRRPDGSRYEVTNRGQRK